MRFGISPHLSTIPLRRVRPAPRDAVFHGPQQLSCILELEPTAQASPLVLNRLYLTSPLTGQQVPLNVLVTDDAAFDRAGSKPSEPVSFRDAVVQPCTGRRAQSGGLRHPTGRSFHWRSTDADRHVSGQRPRIRGFAGSVPLLVLGALFVIYIILGVLYESYFHPLTILSTLPSAGLGALIMLWGFGFDFTVIALIGVILLIGIVKKNGIMIVDFAIAGEREQGLEPEAAIRRACLLRFRPIMMTTMAALLAGVPLMLGHGTGSELDSRSVTPSSAG